MKPIIGLVGPSGSGKTTLILELLKLHPDLRIMKSFTTRPRREPQDDLFYEFITNDELKKMEDANRLTHISEYAGNYYTNNKQYLNNLLCNSFGIAALVQSGINFLRLAGYKVIVIQITPVHSDFIRDINRIQADKNRFKNSLTADLIVENSFKNGGLQISLQLISNFITQQLT